MLAAVMTISQETAGAVAGYFLFMDLGGFVNFVPGTIMRLVSASAILLSGWVWLSNRKD